MDFGGLGLVSRSKRRHQMITENWSVDDPQHCPCHGLGWAEVDIAIWKKCVKHWDGQPYPLSLADQNRDKMIDQEIRVSRRVIKECQQQIRQEEERILQLQLQRINQIPTKRTMPYSIVSNSQDDF